jgi:two-component system, OmpR family, sensor histidine kinase BaeS
MRKLSRKLVLAILVTSLFGVLLVAALVRWQTQQQFDQLTIEEGRAEFLSKVQSYYREHGRWQGVAGGFQRPDPGSGQAPPPFLLVNNRGRVLLGAAGFGPGSQGPQQGTHKSTPIEIDGEIVGQVVTIDQPAPRSTAGDQFLESVDTAVLGAAGAALLVGLVISLILGRTLTRPIGELTLAARRIADGHYEQQVDVRSQDEIGELAAAFNQMSAELARANQSRRQMTADIAHELRTPLTVIHGHLEGLQDGVLKPSPERFSVLYDEAEQLLRLVEDLRLLSLADSGALQLTRRPVDIAELLEKSAAAFQPRAETVEIDLTVASTPGLPTVTLDPQRIDQVLGNLIQNALRYTPAGGNINLRAMQVGNQLEISVEDNGRGIPAEQLEHIFERFYRGEASRHSEGGQSGLGLAIVRSIVAAHGGRIRAESVVGQGTKIQFSLPLG